MTWNVVGNIGSRDEFSAYCLRRLGNGAINIEITQDQIDDCINQALEFFEVRYTGMMTETWLTVRLTTQDATRSWFQAPPGWLSVNYLYDPQRDSGQSTVDDFDNLNYRLANSDFFNFSWTAASDMVTSFHLFQEKINLIKLYFSPETRYRYNPTTGQVTLTRGQLDPGHLFVMQGYVTLDPAVTPDIYNDPWLKKYGTAIMGIQWGANVSKYDGVQLPGGITLNADKIYDRYETQRKELEEEFNSSMESPPQFFME